MEARRARRGLALRVPEGAARAARAGARAVGARAARASSGFEPVIPPVLVREEALFGTGFLPGHRAADLPRARRRPLPGRHLGGAARVAARRRDPRRRASCRCATPASRPCFRREAGAAGKDTRGIFRVHQFDKVEMFSFVEPEESPDEHERLLAIEEEILQALEHPVPRGEHRGRGPRRVGREEVRHRGVAAGPGALPRAHLVLEHDRLPGAPARRALPAGRGRGAAPRCTR